MKKTYKTPYAEKIEFSYSQQVVAASPGGADNNCHWQGGSFWSHSGPTCKDKYHDNPSVRVPA